MFFRSSRDPYNVRTILDKTESNGPVLSDFLCRLLGRFAGCSTSGSWRGSCNANLSLSSDTGPVATVWHPAAIDLGVPTAPLGDGQRLKKEIKRVFPIL